MANVRKSWLLVTLDGDRAVYMDELHNYNLEGLGVWVESIEGEELPEAKETMLRKASQALGVGCKWIAGEPVNRNLL